MQNFQRTGDAQTQRTRFCFYRALQSVQLWWWQQGSLACSALEWVLPPAAPALLLLGSMLYLQVLGVGGRQLAKM